MKILKSIKQFLKKLFKPHLNSKWGRFMCHIQAHLQDHEYIRMLYRNFFKIDSKAYRSSQPSARFVKKLKDKYGIKTIINLRSASENGHYLMEKEACKKYSITLIDTHTSSCSFPEKKDILDLIKIFHAAEYPILMHCKSGADRAGLASTVYQHTINKIPMDQITELSWKYGHFKFAETGKLDVFINTFIEFNKKNPEVGFENWLKNYYNKNKLKHFYPGIISNAIVKYILRRE